MKWDLAFGRRRASTSTTTYDKLKFNEMRRRILCAQEWVRVVVHMRAYNQNKNQIKGFQCEWWIWTVVHRIGLWARDKCSIFHFCSLQLHSSYTELRNMEPWRWRCAKLRSIDMVCPTVSKRGKTHINLFNLCVRLRAMSTQSANRSEYDRIRSFLYQQLQI